MARSLRSCFACAMVIAAMGCGPGPSSSTMTRRVPAAARAHPVVLGGIELCGQAQPVLDLLQGTEHPTWTRAPTDDGGHVVRWHAFTPGLVEDHGRPAVFDVTETVCGRTSPDVLALEVVDGLVAEVHAAWAIPAGTTADGLACKQALEEALGSAKGVPTTHRDDWAERGMALWVWSERGLKTEVLIEAYREAEQRALLGKMPLGPEIDGPVLPGEMAIGDVRVVMTFKCTPLVQQLARDVLRDETGHD